MNENMKDSIITIGLPVYNGEDTINKAIDSLLLQTEKNFQLIISDNASTDSTMEICQKYEEQDTRIRYIRRNENIGWIRNMIFLANSATTEYFMWAADDDYWAPNFIEKNIEFLKNEPEYVASTGNVEHFGKNKNNMEENTTKQFFRTNTKNYEDRVSKIIESNWATNIWSVFRTEILKKSIVKETFVSWDFAILLNLVKFGNFHVFDEILWYRDTEGQASEKSLVNSLKRQKFNWFKIYFPYIPFTIWCVNNLGIKIFLKHFSYFRYINTHASKKIFREIFYKR